MAEKPLDPNDFFLKGREPSAPLTYPTPPVRQGCSVVPLVDGVSTFRAMESAIDGAKSSVCLAAWVFNPATRLQPTPGLARRAATWLDLLIDAAKRGVEVRILIADFDPLFSSSLHQNNWRTYRLMVTYGLRLGAQARQRLQIVVSRHGATASLGLQSRLEKRLEEYIKSLNRTSGVDVQRLQDMPGIWGALTYDRKTKRLERDTDVDLLAFPACHHQKLCIVDGTVAFCGGLDVNSGRIDTPRHNASKTAWHDIHCRLEGPAVADISRNFSDRWNVEARLFLAFRAAANRRGMPVSLPDGPVTIPLALSSEGISGQGKELVQIQRTLSQESGWGPIPNTLVDDVARGTEAAIGAARKFIYIENQYLRSKRLMSWLLARANEIRDLQIIVVLPVAPEEVAARGGADEITNLGLNLQHTFLTTLQAKVGRRFAAFSMIRGERANSPHRTDMFGSRQIYVHSKAMIIDDAFAIVGSANGNDRSYSVDTEMNIAWFAPQTIARLRMSLWSEMLGSPEDLERWRVTDYVEKWLTIAALNERSPANGRRGFVVRHNAEAFPGAPAPYIPNEFAEVLDLESQDAEASEALA